MKRPECCAPCDCESLAYIFTKNSTPTTPSSRGTNSVGASATSAEMDVPISPLSTIPAAGRPVGRTNPRRGSSSTRGLSASTGQVRFYQLQDRAFPERVRDDLHLASLLAEEAFEQIRRPDDTPVRDAEAEMRNARFEVVKRRFPMRRPAGRLYGKLDGRGDSNARAAGNAGVRGSQRVHSSSVGAAATNAR